MEYATQFSGVRLHDFKCVLPRAALVDDYIEPKLRRQIELFLKKIGLVRFVSAIFNAGFQLLFGSALQRAEHLHIFLFRWFDARQMMIIKTGFANSDYAPTLGQVAQWRDYVFRDFFGRGRVHSNYRVDIRILFGKIDS